MKPIRQIFLACTLLLTAHASLAQEGLAVAPLFSGQYNKDKHAVVVVIKGNKLKPYDLSLFHSITIENGPDDVALFEAAVLADSRKAVNSETVKSGEEIIAGYYQLPPASSDEENRFILFRKPSPGNVTLIYLEGDTELEKLINLFIQKK